MGRIYILGNEIETWMEEIGAPIRLPKNLNINDYNEITLFIDNTFRKVKNDDKIIISLDSIAPELALLLGLHIRLSFQSNQILSLLPILFVSCLPKSLYLNNGIGSQLFINPQGIYVCKPHQVKYDIEKLKGISIQDYYLNFLSNIHIEPDSKIGNHSLANQWGINVLSRLLNANIPIEKCLPLRNTLYFKYSLCKYLTSHKDKTLETSVKPIERNSVLNVLLLEDEADKGWVEILQALIPQAKIYTPEILTPYDAIEAKIKGRISDGYYDIIFLDLRLKGSEEDFVTSEKLSGVEILKEIKKANAGNQVIILTASNKAWNFKMLMDNGADGYYIKEDPSYGNDVITSKENLEKLKSQIEICIYNDYLRDIFKSITKIKELIRESNSFGENTDAALSNLDVALQLLRQSYDHPEYRSYAYLQLFLLIEEYVRQESIFEETDFDLYLKNKDVKYHILQNRDTNKCEADSAIFFDDSKYTLGKGKYINRHIDTNYHVSALLIYKFGQVNSTLRNWPQICTIRNAKAAHPRSGHVEKNEIKMICHFLEYFFNEKNAQWRPISDAFEVIDSNNES